LPRRTGAKRSGFRQAIGGCRRTQRTGCVFGLQKRVNSNRMTKQQLIEKVAAKTELGKAEVEAAVDSVLELITETLRSNERVDLRGFGSFVVRSRKERQGRNPRTGETITIAAKRDASFRPGKELTEKLAQGETAPSHEEAV
jgi:DNA-binding protein HU-beta